MSRRANVEAVTGMATATRRPAKDGRVASAHSSLPFTAVNHPTQVEADRVADRVLGPSRPGGSRMSIDCPHRDSVWQEYFAESSAISSHRQSSCVACGPKVFGFMEQEFFAMRAVCRWAVAGGRAW